MTIAPAQHYIGPRTDRQLSMVRCGNVQAMCWLIEDLRYLDDVVFGAEYWPDGSAKPLVIVANADLVTRQRMERYGIVISWRVRLDLTGTYVSYGLEAETNGQP